MLINNKIKLKKLIKLTERLFFLLNASIPLSKALNTLLSGTTDLKNKILLQDLIAKMQLGHSFAESLAMSEIKLPNYYINFIKFGEQVSCLEVSLQQLVNVMNNKLKLRSHIINTISYPTFLIMCSFLLILVFLCSVLPQYQSLFAENANLPYITKLLLSITKQIQKNWQLYIGLVIILLSLLNSFKLNKNMLYLWDKILLCNVLSRGIIINYEAANWFYLFYLASKNHIDILTKCTLANSIIINQHLKHKLQTFIPSLKKGSTITKIMQEANLFDVSVIELINIGEEVGQLTEMLQNVANYYQSQVIKQLDIILKWLEPIILLGLAIFLGLIIAALYLPMVNLGLNIS